MEKKRNSEKKSYEKDIENEELKILHSFNQAHNEPTQFEEKDKYTLSSQYFTSKMRKLSSLLDTDQMNSIEFEITSCIRKARKQRLVVQNFIHSSKQNVTPQRIPWQLVASVSSQGIGNVTASSSSLRHSHADIGSPEYSKYSANHGRH